MSVRTFRWEFPWSPAFPIARIFKPVPGRNPAVNVLYSSIKDVVETWPRLAEYRTYAPVENQSEPRIRMIDQPQARKPGNSPYIGHNQSYAKSPHFGVSEMGSNIRTHLKYWYLSVSCALRDDCPVTLMMIVIVSTA